MPKSYKSKDCSICLVKMTQHTQLVCGHRFHHNCIKTLFCIYMDDKCPICKAKFAYQPSHSRKSRQHLRQRILNKNKNCCGRIDREEIVHIRHYFMKHKIYIPFLERMVKILYEDADENINYIEYTKEWIFLYEKERHYEDGLTMAICNRHY